MSDCEGRQTERYSLCKNFGNFGSITATKVQSFTIDADTKPGQQVQDKVEDFCSVTAAKFNFVDFRQKFWQHNGCISGLVKCLA